MKLGDRMKQYEYVTRTYLPARMPVIIRIDGRSFHTFTKGFRKPFDCVLNMAMLRTTQSLLDNIEGCVFAYTQSDEISLLLKNDQTIDTQAWFENNLSKILSISSSMATLYFNRYFNEEIDKFVTSFTPSEILRKTYMKASEKGALFDSRAFVIPENEINNYFIWRQQDATRNSINMVAQANFSHKELQGLSCDQMQEKLWQEKGINWNDTADNYKRGSAVYKRELSVNTPNGPTLRKKSTIDVSIPVFTQKPTFIFDIYQEGKL